MGAQRNYSSFIRTILMFKEYWSSIEDDKLKPLKEVLSKYEFVEDDEDWDHIPDNKKVAIEKDYAIKFWINCQT